MITYNFPTRRSNTTELKVRSMISQLAGSCSSIDGALNYFNSELNAMPRVNCGYPNDWYKADPIVGKKFEVWHLNSKGDKDRLMAVVTEQ